MLPVSPWTLLAAIVGAAVIAGGGFYCGWRWDQVSITKLQATNAQIVAVNKAEAATNAQLRGANASNQQVCAAAASAAQQNLSIAKSEVATAEARAAKYKGLLDVIHSAAADPTPVSPVVRSTVDGLWNGH